ncbi:hypothetical protein HOS95_gp04 [Salmonella phage vB_SpuP_Spp16]|uniref:Uncharacterized protein n=1 Tax=Salmonella phage vB_SpuP_Spp16 TaxID=2081603 RepID=A0A2P1A4I2_9CAUD|nr:hypothetical protein HOS95_gp04 [Salmonella phage vB_SpuP_Spp16]AVI05055.1 hypothetical protein [Salmonella phage vB_SpuP_Spp16]
MIYYRALAEANEVNNMTEHEYNERMDYLEWLYNNRMK